MPNPPSPWAPILVEPLNTEHAAHLVALQQHGAWEIREGLILGMQTDEELRLWALVWPEPAAISTIQQLEAAHQGPDGRPRPEVPVQTHWHCLCLTSPYHTALARLQIRFVDLPGTPTLAVWFDARYHTLVLQTIATHRRVVITARNPGPALRRDAQALAQLPGITLTFDSGLEIVQALLDLLAADAGAPDGR